MAFKIPHFYKQSFQTPNTKGPAPEIHSNQSPLHAEKEVVSDLKNSSTEADDPNSTKPKGPDWSKAPKLNTKARRDWYTKNNLAQDKTTKLKDVKTDEGGSEGAAEAIKAQPEVKKPTAKEDKIKKDIVTEKKSDVTSAREKKVKAKADVAKAKGNDKKAARLKKRADRIKKRATKGTGAGNLIRKGVAALRGKKGADKDKAVQAQIAANKAKEEDSPVNANKTIGAVGLEEVEIQGSNKKTRVKHRLSKTRNKKNEATGAKKERLEKREKRLIKRRDKNIGKDKKIYSKKEGKVKREK